MGRGRQGGEYFMNYPAITVTGIEGMRGMRVMRGMGGGVDGRDGTMMNSMAPPGPREREVSI